MVITIKILKSVPFPRASPILEMTALLVRFPTRKPQTVKMVPEVTMVANDSLRDLMTSSFLFFISCLRVTYLFVITMA